MKDTSWDRALEIAADGNGLVGHAGVILLRKLADQCGLNKIRWMIEQVISHFKNLTIMHTDYRRPLKTFETTISAVVGLHFYRTA
jgi:hypothetical protein